MLGPPGAGKTTTLRLIVGLERPDEGTIFIDGEAVNDVHPGKRDIAMMFQNLALYPDKTVFDNIAYPLRERKVPQDQIQAAGDGGGQEAVHRPPAGSQAGQAERRRAPARGAGPLASCASRAPI